MAPLRFILNGQPIEVESPDPNQTLLGWLRERGMTGTKEGCAEGECGACAVALVRTGPGGHTRYEAVNSCLLLLGAVAGHEVRTVEGMGDGDHPVQSAMIREGGSQCGYCTPGFVVSMWAEYYRPGRGEPDMESIAGNLCRCTGYRPIRDALRSLSLPVAGDPHLERLSAPAPALAAWSTGSGERRFHRPTGLAELFELTDKEPGARLVAGGTDTVVDMNQRHERFDGLISIDAVAELQALERHEDHVSIGAGVPLRVIEEELPDVPMLGELLPLFSSRLVRNRATLGGNLATASPIGDSPPVLLALDAELRLASASGERAVALADFFTGYRQTVLRPGEVIVSVRVPRPFPSMARFYKVSKRVMDDISTVAAAFALSVADDGVVRRARVAYGGVAPTPIRVREAEVLLVGKRWSVQTARALMPAVRAAMSPMTDHRGSAAYRSAVAANLLERFAVETTAPAPSDGGDRHAAGAQP